MYFTVLLVTFLHSTSDFSLTDQKPRPIPPYAFYTKGALKGDFKVDLNKEIKKILEKDKYLFRHLSFDIGVPAKILYRAFDDLPWAVLMTEKYRNSGFEITNKEAFLLAHDSSGITARIYPFSQTVIMREKPSVDFLDGESCAGRRYMYYVRAWYKKFFGLKGNILMDVKVYANTSAEGYDDGSRLSISAFFKPDGFISKGLFALSHFKNFNKLLNREIDSTIKALKNTGYFTAWDIAEDLYGRKKPAKKKKQISYRKMLESYKKIFGEDHPVVKDFILQHKRFLSNIMTNK